MVFCIIGLAIFAVLGLFSAKYRAYFRGSLHCMRRQIMLKPCDTSFDNEMKAKISAGISKASPCLARFVFRRFALLSWLLLILMVFSTIAVGFGIYNYALYGNCNGPYSSDFCVFGTLSGPLDERIANIKPINAGGAPTLGSANASVKIIEVGCYLCPYTKDAESIRSQLINKYGSNVSFTFRDMPLLSHNLSWKAAEAANCALEQGKYWEYHDKIFEYQDVMNVEKMKYIAGEIGLNTSQFNACLDTDKYLEKVQEDYDAGNAAGIFATPTYFVNGKPIVGLKAFADFEKIVIGEIRGSCPVS